jgi:hypothetical protein
MRVKKVNRYWCDFCNKAGLAAGAMRRHEAHCTLNPGRNCRVCGLLGGSTAVGAERMAELVALMPDSTAYRSSDGIYWDGEQSEHATLTRTVAAVLPKLRAETDNCPACIMATLRLAKIPVPMAEGFDFKTEMRAVLDEWNANNNEDRGY